MAELRVPPGRAGRIWLSGRLGTARRAAALLDHKLHILRTEQERLTRLAERTGADWAAAQSTADRWLVRAAIHGGQRAIRLASPDERAGVRVAWGSVMGVRYPLEATCVPPTPGPEATSGGTGRGSAALIEATAAFQRALSAAVNHAAAVTAVRVIDAEVAETRRRLRAISQRWIPRLEARLHDLMERLEEAERAETVQLRWASRREAAGRPAAGQGR